MENEKLKIYNIIVQVKCVDKVKAKYCLDKMLEGLDSESIWYCHKYELIETTKSFYD